MFVTCALCASYWAHPHIFGFTALASLWATVVVAGVGLGVASFQRALPRPKRAAIVLAVAAAAIAVATALAVLSTFNWA